jgi:hypothetical protein
VNKRNTRLNEVPEDPNLYFTEHYNSDAFHITANGRNRKKKCFEGGGVPLSDISK